MKSEIFTHEKSFITVRSLQANSLVSAAGWLILLLFAGLAAPVATKAATIWNGPTVSVSNATEPDKITANVWLTRGASQGLYNAVTEGGFTHFFSPADTEWADGTTANYASLSYTNWNTWAKGVHAGPPSTVGVNAVVHLITDDIYIDITFTSWGLFGPYSYQRSTLAVPNNPPAVTITNPVNGAVFAAPANITIQASASDPDGTVTNVQFLVGLTVLTNNNTAPYAAVTNNLAAGSYTLFAIASDNNGATTTNSVSIVVDTPPSVTITNPASGTVFTATANVTIQASASDSDGTVTNVQFLIGSTVLTNTATAPFSVVTDNLAADSYTLSAVASDNNGVKNTNTVSISVVTPGQTTVNGTTRTTSTNFQFSYSADVGLSYIV